MGKKIEVTKGQRFGRWTVIEEVQKGSNGRMVRCVCDCGNVKDVLFHALMRGTSKSCGCRRFNGKVKKGDIYGFLTVLGEAPYHIQQSGNKIRRIECQCVCGTIKTYLLPNLRYKDTVSCGCYNRKISHNRKKPIFNIGINDFDGNIKVDGKIMLSYTAWGGMLERCYSEKFHKKHPSYLGCYVCEDWLKFSNFKKWFDDNYNPNTMQGWHLDKDILVKGNRVYSPDKCCFVPNEINVLFTVKKKRKYNIPRGVSPRDNKFAVYYSSYKNKYVGLFDTIEEASMKYKQVKECRIKEVADKWRDKIDKKVYDAMYAYKVELTD